MFKGTCASKGYTISYKTGRVSFPIFGDFTVSLFKNSSDEVDTSETVDMSEIAPKTIFGHFMDKIKSFSGHNSKYSK